VDELGLASAFVIGLLGGVHCVGMCGGIVGALSLGVDTQKRWPLLLVYNIGRISSYALAGAVAGGLGYFFASTLAVQQAQQVLLLIAAVFLILLGLYLAGWWRVLGQVEQLGGYLWKHIEPLGRGLLPIRNARQALAIGLLWGWLPCGLVYSALLWSVAAGSVLDGALLMLAFGLGTLPNLLLMGVAANQLKRWLAKPIVRRVAGAAVAAYGIWLLLRSLA
jgi:sulfite exporter TauE/SafE